jgi:hypothetical protein
MLQTINLVFEKRQHAFVVVLNYFCSLSQIELPLEMLHALYCFQVIYQTADQIRESFLSHLMLLQESIKLFGEVGG